MRTGLSNAYVAEFRTKLGVNALDERGKYSGVLLYRIDTTKSGPRGTDYTGQIISKKYYNHPAVGGPKNLTELWRPIDNSLDGYDSPECCWQPGDVFSDPASGVTISVEEISHYNSSDPSNSPYTADDVATITINYFLYGLYHPSWDSSDFAKLYITLWEEYLEQTGDTEILGVIAPFYVFRGLVLSSPQWYPNHPADVQNRLLHFVENVLLEEHFDYQNIGKYANLGAVAGC